MLDLTLADGPDERLDAVVQVKAKPPCSTVATSAGGSTTGDVRREIFADRSLHEDRKNVMLTEILEKLTRAAQQQDELRESIWDET